MVSNELGLLLLYLHFLTIIYLEFKLGLLCLIKCKCSPDNALRALVSDSKMESFFAGFLLTFFTMYKF